MSYLTFHLFGNKFTEREKNVAAKFLSEYIYVYFLTYINLYRMKRRDRVLKQQLFSREKSFRKRWSELNTFFPLLYVIRFIGDASIVPLTD